MADYQYAKVPSSGDVITVDGGDMRVPARPIIPFIEGDGTGADIWRATSRVLESAVEKAYHGERQIVWMEIYAGEKALNATGEWLPEETLRALQEFLILRRACFELDTGINVFCVFTEDRHVDFFRRLDW